LISNLALSAILRLAMLIYRLSSPGRLERLAAYRDVGYPYMLMPDHVPRIDGRDPSGVAFAYCYGYIQALLDALVPRSNPTIV
jgi:hypothetical protein